MGDLTLKCKLHYANKDAAKNKQMKFTKKLGIFGRVELYATITKTRTKIQTKQAKTRTEKLSVFRRVESHY